MDDYYKDMEKVIKVLNRITRAKNRRIVVRKLLSALFVGACINIIVFTLSKFVILPFSLLTVASILFGISLSAGLLVALKKRLSRRDVARLIDRMIGLSDRLVTTVDLIDGEITRTALSGLQVRDTVNWLNRIDLESVLEPRFSVWHKFLPVVIIVLIVAYFVPPYYAEPREVSQAIKRAGEEIQRTASDVHVDELSSTVAEIVKKAQDAGKAMQNRHFTRRESLQKISNLSRRIDAIKSISELANELDKEMTPERKRLIAELISKLSQDLRDIPELSDTHKVISEVSLDQLTDENLKALANALNNRRLSKSDSIALMRISSQLMQAKQAITGGASISTERASTSPKEVSEERAGTPGEGMPGSEEDANTDAQGRKEIDSGQIMELPTHVSRNGHLLATGVPSDAEVSKPDIPYQRLYAIYRGSMEHEINTQSIPKAYRRQVIRYFDSIRPDTLQRK